MPLAKRPAGGRAQYHGYGTVAFVEDGCALLHTYGCALKNPEKVLERNPKLQLYCSGDRICAVI